MLNRENIDNRGNNNINNTGDGNTFNITYNFSTARVLNRTYLFDFCIKFSKIEDGNGNYSTDLPTDINDKIQYNEIDLYKDIFMECDHYYDDVESILNEFPNRQRILVNINILYKRIKQFESWINKDELCDKVFRTLLSTVSSDRNSGNLISEDVVLAIHSLMYYAFVKCKFLDPIPQTVDG